MPATRPPPTAVPVPAQTAYQALADAGYHYGPAFQGLRAAWQDGPDSYAEITLPPDAGPAAGFLIHPALLDAAFHPWAVTALASPGRDPGQTLLPFSWAGVQASPPAAATTVHVRLSPPAQNGDGPALTLTAADPAGNPVITVTSLHLRPVPAAQLSALTPVPATSLYHLTWAPLATAADVPAGADRAGGAGGGGARLRARRPSRTWGRCGRRCRAVPRCRR